MGREVEPHDIKDKYDVFFPIYSKEGGKRFYSLTKRKFSMPKYFDDKILGNIGIQDFSNSLCERIGWT